MPSYLILDAAQNCLPSIRTILPDIQPESHCLYLLNEYNAYLADVAPFLFPMTDALEDHFMEHGRGKAWGIVVQADLDYDQLRFHLRRFLKVKEALSENQLLFRFYDPRVLNMVLPVLDKGQLKEFFGPYVKCFIAENKDGINGKKYSFNGNELAVADFHNA